ncbi:MAG: Gfo/Idh/MocA family oxidoreductase [Firmicutes bacterium]|nr:Gfo/Idh/MocA family oxidoreductase [Bacillota bacterium]
MFRVGIIGSENSHAMAFSEIFNLNNKEQYPDIQVVAIYGEDQTASEAVRDKCGVEIMTPEEMLSKVDAVMVTSRDGALHSKYAKPFIEAGIPAFVDKPLTCNIEDAIELMRLARDKQVPIVGGSSLKYPEDLQELKQVINESEIRGADLAAPVSMVNPYGGFFFYAAHLVEMTMAIFGSKPQRVSACRTKDSVTATVRFEKCDVTNHFNEGNYHYSATIYTKDKTVFKELDVSKIYQHECDAFAHMLRSGEMEQTYEELVMPVAYIAAIQKAYETGEEQIIQEIHL